METRRKNIRLAGWDYSNTAWYFVTICCKDQRKYLGDVVDETGVPLNAAILSEDTSIGNCSMRPSAEGQICADVLHASKIANSASRIMAYVVMPNHVHFVVGIRHVEGPSPTLGSFIRYIKSTITKAVRKRRPEIELWQRGYYEHIIRDDDDFQRILEYIEKNPAKWADDRYFS